MLVMTAFLALPSQTEIVKAVQKQLMNYNYTFPKAPNVSAVLCPDVILHNSLPVNWPCPTCSAISQ